MLYEKQILRFFKKTAGISIERRALLRLIFHFESEMEKMVNLCVQEQKKINAIRKLNGNYCKKKVEETSIIRAIELKKENYDIPSEKIIREVLKEIGDKL